MIESIFFIMTMFGQVTMVAGPVPYTETECITRAENMFEEIKQGYIRVGEPPVYKGRTVPLDEIKIGCEIRHVRPDIGDHLTLTNPVK